MATSVFSEDPIDDFSCKICLEILKKPVQCQANEHYFCTQCITEHLKKSQTCPLCREHLTLQTLRPVPRVLANLLTQYDPQICKYVDRGCKEKIKKQDLLFHYTICDFAPVVCSIEGCGKTVNRQDQESHEESCMFRKIKCESCKEEMVYRDYQKHSCVLRMEIDELKSSLVEMNSRLKEIQEGLKAVQRKPTEVSSRPHLNPQASSLIVQQHKPTTSAKGRLVVAGGNNNNTSYEIFDNTKKSWTLYENAFFFARWNSFSFPYDNNIMICGGNHSKKIESLDMNSNSSSTTRVSLPSRSGKGVLCGDHIITFGDSITKTHLKPPYSSEVVLKYDERESRSNYGVEFVNGKVFLVGGAHWNDGRRTGTEDDVMVYNPSTNEFTKLTPLPYEVRDVATVPYKDNIIILGGEVNPGDQYTRRTKTAMMYNITTQQCKMLPSMLEKRSRAAAVIIGERIVVMGGCDSTGRCLRTAEYLILGSSSWKKFPSLQCDREGATAIHFKFE